MASESQTTGHSYRTCPRCLRIMPETLDCTCDPDMVLVPRVPTKKMLSAAGNAMRLRKETMGDDWFRVATRIKAAIRWEAMLKAWEEESAQQQEVSPT